MAAKTPSTITKIGTLGNATLVKAVFTDLDDTDTWASGMSGVIGQWFNRTDDPTTQASVGMSVSESSGTFTFYPAEDDTAGALYVLRNDA